MDCPVRARRAARLPDGTPVAPNASEQEAAYDYISAGMPAAAATVHAQHSDLVNPFPEEFGALPRQARGRGSTRGRRGRPARGSTSRGRGRGQLQQANDDGEYIDTSVAEDASGTTASPQALNAQGTPNPTLNAPTPPGSLPPSRPQSRPSSLPGSRSNSIPPHSRSGSIPPPSRLGSIRVGTPADPPSYPLHGADVDFFFYRDRDNRTDPSYCTICKVEEERLGRRLPYNFTFAATSSITNLRCHIEFYHLDAYTEVIQRENWLSLLPGRDEESSTEALIQRPSFSRERFLQHLVALVVSADQAFALVEKPAFRQLLLLISPFLDADDIPKRKLLQEAFFGEFHRYWAILKNDLLNSLGKISFTGDAWSDQHRRSYFAITAHWVARDGEDIVMRSALIAFHNMRIFHDGASVAELAFRLVGRLGIESKSGWWTLDNAAYNRVFVEHYATKLHAIGLPLLSSEELKIGCFPHIVNISTQKVVRAIGLHFTNGGPVANPPPPPAPDDHGDLDDAQNLAARDPLALVRAGCRWIRASGKRREDFQATIREGNRQGRWMVNGQVVQLRNVEVILDVVTRWDSTAKMNERYLELEPALDYFFQLPHNKEGAAYRLTPAERTTLNDIAVVLSVPSRIQQALCSENTPNLSFTIPNFEWFILSWERLARSHPRLRTYIQPGLDSARQYYKKMDTTTAYVISMFINPHIRLAYVFDHWLPLDQEKAVAIIKSAMNKYHRDVVSTPSNTHAPAPAQPSSSDVAAPIGIVAFLAQQYGVDPMGPPGRQIATTEQEYNAYMSAVFDPTLSILNFWKIHGRAFPTIYAMALDYLPIQASSVPCERVFSSSATTDTKKRNRLSPEVMEALQILKFGLKGNLNFMTGWASNVADLTTPEPDSSVDLLASFLAESETGTNHNNLLAMLVDDDD